MVPLFASLALHGAAGMWVKVRAPNVESRSIPQTDVWSGRGIEIEPGPVEMPAAAAPSEDPAEAAEPSTDTVEPVVAAPRLEPACVVDCARTEVATEPRAPERRADLKPAASATRRTSPRDESLRKPPTPDTARSSTHVSTTAASTAASSGAPSGEAFGTAGLPPGVRFLPLAYTRAISQGGWGVPGFRSAPTGKLCDARVSIAVADDHSLGPVEYGGEAEREAVPPLCRTLFENARRLIVSGEFSLDAKSLTNGTMRLEITVEVTDGEPRTETEGENAPNGLWSESHEPVSAGRRGRSTFVLNSGRRVNAFVELGSLLSHSKVAPGEPVLQ